MRMAVAVVPIAPCRLPCTKTTPAPQYGHTDHSAIRSLPQHGRSNHRNNDHDGSYNQPLSPPCPCPRRPIVLLLRIVYGSLGCPSGLFFLLSFLRFSHGLPFCYGAVVVVALAV